MVRRVLSWLLLSCASADEACQGGACPMQVNSLLQAGSLQRDSADEDLRQNKKILIPDLARKAASLACEESKHVRWVNDVSLGWTAQSNQSNSASFTYGCGTCSLGCEQLIKEQCGENSYHPVTKCQPFQDGCPPIMPISLDDLLNCSAVTPDDVPASLVMFGSSHTRVLFFHIYRLLTGKYWPTRLEEWMIQPAAGGGTGLGGWQNHSISVCNGKRVLKTLFHYKTWYRTPETEQAFLARLQETGMTEPDLFVTEYSIWSEVFAETMLQNPPNLDQERTYFINWVQDHFQVSQNIVLLGNAEGNDRSVEPFAKLLSDAATHNPNFKYCGFDRETLGRSALSEAGEQLMTCPHGCDGPVVMIQAQMFVRAIGVLFSK